MPTKKKAEKPKIDKDNFIEYLASMTPGEINQMIASQGKPPKVVEPIYFYRDK